MAGPAPGPPVPSSAPPPAHLTALPPKPFTPWGTHSLHRRENLAARRVIHRTPFVSLGGARRREIALTFDDGPGPDTSRLLKLLRRLHVRATFFWVGHSVREFPEAAREELRDGHAVGNHTERHSVMAHLPENRQRAEIEAEETRAQSVGLGASGLFRPPYGSFNKATLKVLARLRMLMVLWSVDAQDYRRPGVSVIVKRVLDGARPGAIVLLHDGGGSRSQTLAAVPVIVRELRRREFRLVTVPELLLDNPPSSDQTVPLRPAG